MNVSDDIGDHPITAMVPRAGAEAKTTRWQDVAWIYERPGIDPVRRLQHVIAIAPYVGVAEPDEIRGALRAVARAKQESGGRCRMVFRLRNSKQEHRVWPTCCGGGSILIHIRIAIRRVPPQRVLSARPSRRLRRRTSAPVRLAWMYHPVKAAPGTHVVADHLFNLYEIECRAKNRPTLTKTAFGRAIAQLRPTVEKRQRSVNGRLCWCYTGIGLLTSESRDLCFESQRDV